MKFLSIIRQLTGTALFFLVALMICNTPAMASDIATVEKYRNAGRTAEAIELAESLRPDPHALYLLSKLYALPGATQDLGKAQNLGRLAKRQGFDPVAAGVEKPIEIEQGLRAFQDARLALNQRRSRNEVRALLEVAVDHGNRDAMKMLGEWLIAGIGGPKNTRRGISMLIESGDHLLKNAVQGDPDAQYGMGQRYADFINGAGLHKRDVEQSMVWYGRAAAQGHPEALSDLGWAILFMASDNPFIVNALDGTALEQAEGLLLLAKEQGSRTASKRLARVQTLRSRKESRDALVGIAVGVLALMAHAAANAPDDVAIPQNTWKRDNCTGMNGLGWISTSAGNAAAIFGGCSRY